MALTVTDIPGLFVSMVVDNLLHKVQISRLWNLGQFSYLNRVLKLTAIPLGVIVKDIDHSPITISVSVP